MTTLRREQLLNDINLVAQGQTPSSTYTNIVLQKQDENILIDMLVSDIRSGTGEGGNNMSVRFAHAASILSNGSKQNAGIVEKMIFQEIENAASTFESSVRETLKNHTTMFCSFILE